MALQGSLEEFGIADIFQLIGQQHKSGTLVVSRKENTVHIRFREGKILGAEMQNRDRAQKLGTLMLEAGLLDEDQLQTALDTQRKTLKKIGSILIEQGVIAQTDLDQFLYLQTKETIFRLFRWNAGTYEFQPQDEGLEDGPFEPIDAEHILMDGFRILDEWPTIRKKLGSMGTVFERVPGAKIPHPAEAASLDKQVDAAFSALGGEAGEMSWEEALSPNCERILQLVNGEYEAKSIIAQSRLGEFEASHALVQLLELNLIRAKLVVEEEEGLEETPQRRSISLYQDYESPRSQYVMALPKLATGLTYVLALVVFLGAMDFGPMSALFRPAGLLRVGAEPWKFWRAGYAEERIRVALDASFLERGFYPKELTELVDQGFLRESDLRGGAHGVFVYRLDGNGYVLERPLD